MKDIPEEDIELLHRKYWSLNESVKERQYIQRNIEVSNIKRLSESPKRKCCISIKYFLQTKEGPVRVCKQSFLSILSVGTSKVEHAAEQILESDEDMRERSSGARISEESRKLREEIITHIESFRCRKSHYEGTKQKFVGIYPHISMSAKYIKNLF